MKKKRSLKKHLTALAVLRARHADRNFAGMKRAVQSAMNNIVEAISNRARSGHATISEHEREAWKAALVRAISRPMLAMAVHGFKLAGAETVITGKSFAREFSGKAIGDSGVGFSNDREKFILPNKWPNLDKWVNTTAESANNTLGQRMLGVFESAAAFRDPETGRGRTPKEIADELLSSGLDISDERASLLAKTGSIWAYNEGAIERYSADGVEVVEWLTAEDDMTCPFCAEMNGKRVETSESFFSNGDKFQVGEGALTFGKFDVKHPPLHPNCRCTMIPVVDSGQL